MRVLMAMSGGVDSSVAAAELIAAGHDVVGVTMRLWGGESDTGCCSVSDVEDARRVAQQLGIDHVVFNFTEDFNRHVVDPYVDAHRIGVTPNPCIECNRHLKFERLSERARVLGFEAVATGHHARIIHLDDGTPRLARAHDRAKDQSYVLYTCDRDELDRTLFPVGSMTKDVVREKAVALGLRTATKPDSQDVCFISRQGGRESFLGNRIPLRRARVVGTDGQPEGEVESVELVTLGQRRGLGGPGGGPKKFVVDIKRDGEEATVVVGPREMLMTQFEVIDNIVWPVGQPDEVVGAGLAVMVQCSAHGETAPATLQIIEGRLHLNWFEPHLRVSPGQSVVFYDPTDTYVVGGGIVSASRTQ